jgi:AraC-like DNA-binding protein
MSSLDKILRDKLIPWSENSAGKRFVVARTVMKKTQLPEDARLEQRKISGKRVPVKQRGYANAQTIKALWPEAHLNEDSQLKLVCVVSGQTAYQINDYLLHANEGVFMFLPPGTPHPDGILPHLENNTGYCELFNTTICRRALHCWLCYSKDDEHYGFAKENYLLRDESLLQLFRLLMEEAVAEKESSQIACQNLLTAFFIFLHRELQAGCYLLAGPAKFTDALSRGTNDFTSTLREYLQAHLNEPLTLESVARRMHLSRSQFARQVKQETGATFVEMLTQCRIAEAKLLLQESEWSTAIIAEFVGFKSVTYFHHLFVQRTGITPGQFRQQARKNKPPKIKYDIISIDTIKEFQNPP